MLAPFLLRERTLARPLESKNVAVAKMATDAVSWKRDAHEEGFCRMSRGMETPPSRDASQRMLVCITSTSTARDSPEGRLQ